MTIFISHAVAEERIGFGPSEVEVPADRERWKRLAALYRASFVECGVAIEDVVRPEIYQTDVARTVLGVANGDWHLAVKPPPHLRPFHGLPNAFVFDGEDGGRASGPDGPSPFSNPLVVLGHADAVLCTTEASASSLRTMGIGNAIFLPPCLPMPPVSADRGSPHVSDDGTVRIGTFLDRDVSLDTLGEVVQGLVEARTRNAGLKLVVVVPPGVRPPDVAAWVARRFDNETARAVSSISLDFDRPRADDRPTPIDYMLSVGPEDGLSIGLARAMGHGIPSIGGDDVATALLEAAAADMARRREMSASARRSAESRFGTDAFKARVADLQRRLGELSS